MECYKTIIESNETSAEARLQTLKTCEELGMSEEISVIRKGVSFDETPKLKRPHRYGASKQVGPDHGLTSAAFVMIAPRLARRPGKDNTWEKTMREQAKAEETRTLFLRMKSIKETSRDGNQVDKSQWMLAAKTLIQDFQSERLFYPFDKYVRFYGYSKEARRKSLNSKAVQAQQEAEAINRKLCPSLGRTNEMLSILGSLILVDRYLDDSSDPVPNEFRSIHFHVWLDIFLEYAMALAKSGDTQSAYEVLTSASSANVFYHSPDWMFLVQVCWFSELIDKP